MEKENLMFALNIQLFADDEKSQGKETEDEANDDGSLLDEGDLDFNEDEADENDDSQSEGNGKEKSKSQTRKDNHYYAQLRREKEQKKAEQEKALKDSYLKGQLDLAKVNKFTDEPIEDELDLEDYKLQLQIEKDGGDPIEDLAKYKRQKIREERKAKLEKEKEEQDQNLKIENDVKAFRSKYPDIDYAKLIKDEKFIKFAGKRLGRDESLSEIYEDYTSFTKEIKGETVSDVEKQKAIEDAKKKSSTPSTSGITPNTTKSYLEMTKEERIKFQKEKGWIS